MGSCNREELWLKWSTERNALRQECHGELRHRLLDVAEVHMPLLKEDRKAMLALYDGALIHLRRKLDAVALSGKQLSHNVVNSLAAILAHRIAAASSNQSRKIQGNHLETQGSRNLRDNDVDYAQNSRRHPAPSTPLRSETKSQTSDTYADTSDQRHQSSSYAMTTDSAQEHDAHSHSSELAELLRERNVMDRQLFDERNLLANRFAYLRECRVAAEKEKELAQKELAAAMSLLAKAEQEREAAAGYRATAMEELKDTMPLHRRSRARAICCASLGRDALEVPEKRPEHSAPTSWTPSQQLSVDIARPSISPPLLIHPIVGSSTSPVSLCKVRSNERPEGSPFTPPATDVHNGTCSVSQPTCLPNIVSELDGNEELQDPGVAGHSGVNDQVAIVPGTLENPIGPYIRPPMPLEDMLKCVRCLFGKDKSLKTGNRARAFLGVPWSEIVSFDPDILLRRGVLGIKEGSTGMASRLRMMTIIESALSNQNDDSIPVEVWERPTHFCDNCQKRYPITVSSNQTVPPLEESVQRDLSPSPYRNSADGINPRSQESNGTVNSRGKRNKKKLRGARPGTHLPR